MENALNLQCNSLLNRVKLSKSRPGGLINRSRQDNQRKLKSLSIYKRKINQNILKKQFSLKNNLQTTPQGWQQGQAIKKVQKLLAQSQSSQNQNQLQFNLRKGTKIQKKSLNCSVVRKPFSNLANTNKFKLTLSASKQERHQRNINKQQIQKTLLINHLVSITDQNKLRSPYGYRQIDYSQKLQIQKVRAFYNANIVSQIYGYIKEKSNQQGQKIGEFTQIIFKLVCYYFVSYVDQLSQERLEKLRLIQFVQKQMGESHGVIDIIKQQGSLNKNSKNQINSNQINVDNRQDKAFVRRKQKRVISFFKAMQYPQNLINDQPQNEGKFQKDPTEWNEQQKEQIQIFKIPPNSNNRRMLIAINAVNAIKEDNKQENSESCGQCDSNETQRERSELQISTKQIFPKIVSRSNTRRKSCFLSQMKSSNKFSSISQNQSLKRIQNLPTQLLVKHNSNNDSTPHARRSSFIGLFHPKVQGQDNRLQINQKSLLSSKLNLNISSPQDFHKQDTLMAKRIKYLQLCQQIAMMTENIEQIKKDEMQIIRNIEEKDSVLIGMQNKIIQMKRQIQQFQARNREAQSFLNGPDCPQMAQKIIKKKGQIQKSLKSLINYNAWYSSNLAQSSHIQNIVQTKQNSLDKLNFMTRKMRGCKNIEDIEGIVTQMRQTFLITVQKYSQIINQFQDKIKQAEQSRSNMLKSLQDWEMQTKIKQKLVNSSFLDYYSVERKVSIYIQNLPQSLSALQRFMFKFAEQQRKSENIPFAPINSRLSISNFGKSSLKVQEKNLSSDSNEINCNQPSALQNQAQSLLRKMKSEIDVVSKQLYKQKKFAMVLQKII